MKKILFLGACLWALAGQAQAQTAPADIVVVRVRDGGGDYSVLITRGEGKNEMLTFKGGVTDKNFMQSGEGYHKFISKLYQEGYTLQSTFGQATYLTTMIFIKKQ